MPEEPSPIELPDLPERFSDLPAEEQRRLLIASDHMSQLVYRRAASILVAEPPGSVTRMNNGSGFILQLSGGYYLGTAWHVVEAWRERRGRGEPVQFQVRDAILEPTPSRTWVDRSNDLAFVSLSPDEVAQIGVSECQADLGWPPPHPQAGDYVLVSGFPGYLRQEPDARSVDLGGISTLLQVTRVGETYVACQFEREHWISSNPKFPPPVCTFRGVIPRGTEG